MVRVTGLFSVCQSCFETSVICEDKRKIEPMRTNFQFKIKQAFADSPYPLSLLSIVALGQCFISLVIHCL